MRLFGGVSAAPGYGVLVPKGRWLKVLQGKLSLCTGGTEPSWAGSPFMGSPWMGIPLLGTPLKGIPFRGTPFKGSPFLGSPFKGSSVDAATTLHSPRPQQATTT